MSNTAEHEQLTTQSGRNIVSADYEKGKKSRDFVTVNPNAIGRVVLSVDEYNNATFYVGTIMPCLAEVKVSSANRNVLASSSALKVLIERGLDLIAENTSIVAGLDTYRIPVEFEPVAHDSLPRSA